MKTRKEQFDSAVRNSLDQVSKDVEYAETMRWLVEDISDAERKALTENNTSLGQNNVVRGTQRFQVKSRDGKIISDFELRVMKIKPSELPKAMVRGRNTIPQTSNSMLEAIKNRYMYQHPACRLFSDDRPQAQVNAGGRSHGDHSAKKLPGGQAEKDGFLMLANLFWNFDLDKKSPHILAKI